MVTVSKELQQTLQARGRGGAPAAARVRHARAPPARDDARQGRAEILLACGADLKLLERELEEYLDRTLESSRDVAGPGADARLPARPAARRHARAGRRAHARSTAGDVLVAIIPRARLARGLPAREAGRRAARHPQLHLARHRQGGRRRHDEPPGRTAARGRRGRRGAAKRPARDASRVEPRRARARRAGSIR